jgi:transcriptional regulator with XRE-family HTH domain
MTAETAVGVPSWTVGDRLRKARQHANLTAEHMAGVCRVTVRTIHNYESDHTRVPWLVLKAYDAETGVPVEWLTDTDTSPVTLDNPDAPLPLAA